MKRNLIKLTKIYSLVFVFGICYAIFYKVTDIAIPCVFYEITGFKCPSCGVTRMVTALIFGNVHEAFLYNRLMFVLLPLFGVYFVRFSISYIKNQKIVLYKWDNVLIILLIIILVIFGIVRNIYGW